MKTLTAGALLGALGMLALFWMERVRFVSLMLDPGVPVTVDRAETVIHDGADAVTTGLWD